MMSEVTVMTVQSVLMIHQSVHESVEHVLYETVLHDVRPHSVVMDISMKMDSITLREHMMMKPVIREASVTHESNVLEILIFVHDESMSVDLFLHKVVVLPVKL